MHSNSSKKRGRQAAREASAMSVQPVRGAEAAPSGTHEALNQRASTHDWRPWGVGGSDVGAILGLSPFRSAVDVWLDKVHRGAAPARPSVVAQRVGTYLEPFVVQEYERLTGNNCQAHPQPFHHPDHPELFGHVDRMVTQGTAQATSNQTKAEASRIVLECKTCSAFRAGEWGPAWSDLVPAEYLVQCLWYLGLAGCEEAHLAVLLGNTDLRVYRIRRDEALERHLFERAHRFWLEHVLTGTPPPPRTRDQVESLYPTHTAGLTREASPEMLTKLSRLAQLQEEVRLAEQELDEIRQEVALEMGPAEALTWGGQTLATWRHSRESTRLDTQRLRHERPDIVQAYTRQVSAGRRLLLATLSSEPHLPHHTHKESP